MRLIDYAPYVLLALRNGPVKQTDLTEAIFGSSGRGSPALINSLFPYCIRKGWVTMTRRGRAKVYSLSQYIFDCVRHNTIFESLSEAEQLEYINELTKEVSRVSH